MNDDNKDGDGELTFFGDVPCVSLCAKCFTWIISLDSHHPMMYYYPRFIDAELVLMEINVASRLPL